MAGLRPLRTRAHEFVAAQRILQDERYTLQSLAEDVGISKSYLFAIFSGEYDPSDKVVERLAKVMGSTPRGIRRALNVEDQ